MNNVFSQHQDLFDTKPLLRRIYSEDFFTRLRGNCRIDGPTVEIGSGPGLLKRTWPEIISTDVEARAGLNAALDACRLPFRSHSVNNIVGLDVLHHLPQPLSFLTEAELSEAARTLGLTGIALLPVLTGEDGQVILLQVCYSGEVQAWEAAERQLLETAARTLTAWATRRRRLAPSRCSAWGS